VLWESECPADERRGDALRQATRCAAGDSAFGSAAKAAQSWPEKPARLNVVPRSANYQPHKLQDYYVRRASAIAEQGSAVPGARASSGWGQSLWEGLFRALRFQNTCGRCNAAELRPRWSDHQLRRCLFKRAYWASAVCCPWISRVLKQEPTDLRRFGTMWRERRLVLGLHSCPELWRFHGLRPANHPQRAWHWPLVVAGSRPAPRSWKNGARAISPDKELASLAGNLASRNPTNFGPGTARSVRARFKKAQP